MTAALHPTPTPQLDSLVHKIRKLSADSTAIAIQQGRLLLQVEAQELYLERYPSMAAFLDGEPLGIGAPEARKRMQVALLVEAEPGIPAGLGISVLKRLVPLSLAAEHRAAFEQIIATENLPGLSVAAVEALIVELTGRRHVATPDDQAQRHIGYIAQMLQTFEEACRYHQRSDGRLNPDHGGMLFWRVSCRWSSAPRGADSRARTRTHVCARVARAHGIHGPWI